MFDVTAARHAYLIGIVGAVLLSVGCGGGNERSGTAGSDRFLRVLIVPSAQTIAPGSSLRLKLVAQYVDGSREDVSARATWRSSAPEAVSIRSNGIAVGRRAGTAIVRAAVDGQTALATVGVGKSSMGPLRTRTANPSYFVDARGRPVYLTGSHTWSTLVDNGTSDPPPPFDYGRFLDFVQTHGFNVFRLWAWEQARWTTETDSDYWFAPIRYRRTGPELGLDGKPRVDVTKLDPAYFRRLRQRVIAARERGIYTIVMLFNGWSVERKHEEYKNPWDGHPLNKANSVNGIDPDRNRNGGGEEVHTLAIPAVTRLQEAYVRAVVDAVTGQPNVLYEICNECSSASTAWQAHMIRFVRKLEAAKRIQHPVGMTAEYPGGDNQELLASPANWISPSGSVDDPEPPAGGKVVLADTDHFCGICGDERFPWRALTRGLNPLMMDGYDGRAVGFGACCDYDPDDERWGQFRRALGAAHLVADRLDLTSMRPRGDLASTGYCLADTSRRGRYLVYLPDGGSGTVDLTATPGTLRAEWISPATGATVARATVAGGGRRTLKAPLEGHAVLLLSARR